MKLITLRQLTEMFASLPDRVLDKTVSFLDLGNIKEDELERVRECFLNYDNDSDDWIQESYN